MYRMRSPTYGKHGMVATSQVAASQIGVDTLQRGGSAIDAAIAANACLALTEPHMCGPGGDLFALIWDPDSNTLHGLNASGRSASRWTYDDMANALDGADVIPGRGPLSVSVPGAVDGWCALHSRFGRLPLEAVFAPVCKLARDGVPIGSRTVEYWKAACETLNGDPTQLSHLADFNATFMPDGRTPKAGATFVNPGFATTLEAIARGGRDAFYGDQFGDRLTTYLEEHGSPLRPDDLQRQHHEWVEPLTTRYRDADVFELPPNGQGLCVIEMLNVLERFPVAEFGFQSADYWHAFIEAKKLAFEDRARYYADPAAVDVPVETLASKQYAEVRAALINTERAGSQYTHGDVAIKSGDTTYLTAADDRGMMVSLIQSTFSPFGSGLVVPGSGFSLQCRAAGFTMQRDHPNVYAPSKRPFHTIIPAFVMKGGQPWMSFGVMGADMQPQGQVQVLANMLDFGMDPQAAGDAPRMRHFGGRQPNGEQLDGLGVVQYEDRFSDSLVGALRERGHRMEPITDWISGFTGGYQGIQRDSTNDCYVGATESRLDGAAVGY